MARSRKNKTIGCGCDYCMSRGIRRDFRHGAVDESDFEEVDYTPRRKKKGCKKSKTGEPCEFTIVKILHSYPHTPRWRIVGDEDAKYMYHWTVKTCERCGKHGWSTYSSYIERVN